MQGVQGHSHSHGTGRPQLAVDGGGPAGGAQQGDQAGETGRGRRRKRKRKGGAGQGEQGVSQLTGGGSGASGMGAMGGMSGCSGAKSGSATLGLTGGGMTALTGGGMTGLTGGGAGAGTAAAAPAGADQLALLAGGTGEAPAAAPNPLIQTALAQLQGSPVATQVLQALQTAGAKIETVSDAEMASTFGARTQGAFDPKTNTITLPQSVASDPQKLRLVLFHEGVHWLQDNLPGGAEQLGGPIGDALRSAGAVRHTSGKLEDMQHDEAQAYVLEALVANELGIRDTGLGVDRTGRAIGYDATLQKVKGTAEYS